MSDNINGFPVPEEPETREEQYLSAIAQVTPATQIPPEPLTRVEAYLNKIVENGTGGGGGGTTNYNVLENKPQINSHELSGNKSSSDLGLQPTLTTAQQAAVDSGIDSTKVQQISTNTTNISLKANTSDVNSSVANLQNQINQIEISASAEAVVAPEVAAARVAENGTTYDTLKERIDAADIANISEVFIGKNIFFSEWSTNGYSIDQNTGADKSENGYQRTGYIEVEESTTYTASTDFGYAPTVFVFYYDSSKNFISVLQTVYGFYPKTFTTPQNTKYIRFKETYQAMPTNFQIEKGSIATSYEAPYKKLAIPAENVYGIPQELPDGGLAGQLLMKTSEGCEWASATTGNGILYEDKKFLFLGDSITAETGTKSWVDKFKVLVSANTYSYNQAVGGAKWCDSESGLNYDGEPYNDMNFIGNQVAWCQRIGFSSSAFDYIIISAGTNDTNTSYPTDTDVETEMYTNNTIKALADVDRSTWQGAIRWSVQTLRSMYPNAKIILVSPIQRRVAADGTTLADMYPTIKSKRDTVEKMARRMGTYYIDTAECDITNFNSADYEDGLHLSTTGAQKLAEFIFRKSVPIICEYA